MCYYNAEVRGKCVVTSVATVDTRFSNVKANCSSSITGVRLFSRDMRRTKLLEIILTREGEGRVGGRVGKVGGNDWVEKGS